MTDYELYQILEANGFETTKENLYILKEGLANGEYEIVNESEDFYSFVEQCFNEEISAENLILTEDLANKFVKKSTSKIYTTINYQNQVHSNGALFGLVGAAVAAGVNKGKSGNLKKIMDKAKSDPSLQKYIKKIESYNGKELTPEVKKEIKAQVKMALKYLKQIKYYKVWLKAQKKEEKQSAKNFAKGY